MLKLSLAVAVLGVLCVLGGWIARWAAAMSDDSAGRAEREELRQLHRCRKRGLKVYHINHRDVDKVRAMLLNRATLPRSEPRTRVRGRSCPVPSAQCLDVKPNRSGKG